jgi:hypothetical protein
MKKELSPSEYEQIASTRKAKYGATANPNLKKCGAIAIVALVLCGVSFSIGMSYQKGKQPTTTTASTNDTGQFPSQGGGPGGFGGDQGGGFRNGQRPNIGEVSSISSDSITIKGMRSASDQTFKITSSTTVQNDGSSASVSDIKTGDTVLITTDSSDASTATQIMLNPSFGPPGGSNGSLQSSPTSPGVEDSESI